MDIVDERLKLLEVIKNGFAGVVENGMIVDRRERPDAIPIQKNDMLGAPEPKALHTCVICNKTDVWSDSWSWYGSLKDLDDGDVKIKVCSEACYFEYENNRGTKAKSL